VDLYSAGERARKVIYQTSWSSVGPHVLKVVNLGTAGRPRVDVDAFMRLY
jgi:hypothetical protein